MAITLFLSGCTHFPHHPPIPHPLHFQSGCPTLKFTPPSSHSKPIQCHTTPPPTPKHKPPNSISFDAILNFYNAVKRQAIALILAGALLVSGPFSALAASGGRMGGSAFESSSSSGSYSSSSSWGSTPSESYSSSSSFWNSRPSEIYRSDSEGSAFSDTTQKYWSSTSYAGRHNMGPTAGFEFGASLTLGLAIAAAFLLVSGFLRDRHDGGILTGTEKTSVVKLQVGLLGMARSLQRDLNQIAERADTSTPKGLSSLLTETTLAMLRHPDYCISSCTSVDVKKSINEGETRFKQLSIEERGKFDEETLVNVNNIRRQRTVKFRGSGFGNEYIVITILVAVKGVHKLPTINGCNDLKDALQKLGSIPSSRTMAVEVLWTPQEENDILTERELLEEYPLLKPL